MQQVELKHIKICLLGGKKVGKTFLAHKLVDREYNQYLATIECQKFIKQLSYKKEMLIYYDFPSINNEIMQQIIQDHAFDMIVCLFQESISFGQLYEFLESISIKTEESNHKFNDYWQKIRNFILVYSELDRKEQVKIQQLFNVLIREIRNFNRSATIKQFVLRPQLQNYQYLKQMIQKNRYQEHLSEENMISEREIANNEHNQERVADNTISKAFKHSQQEQIKIINNQQRNKYNLMLIPDLDQVKQENGKEKLLISQNLMDQVDNFQTLGKRQQYIQQRKSNINSLQGQSLRYYIIDQQQISNPPINNKKSINQTGQTVHQQNKLQVKAENLQEKNNEMANQNHKSVQISIKNKISQLKVERQQVFEQEKPKQHYREVFDKLMEKINYEQIQQSKKTSYQNLFEQFRQTSKDESKIAIQLKEYWEQKINKFQEEDDEDDAQEPVQVDGQQDQNQEVKYVEAPPQQEKTHRHPADNKHKKHGEPLKPHSSLQDVGKHKHQKKPPETKPCFCLIM